MTDSRASLNDICSIAALLRQKPKARAVEKALSRLSAFAVGFAAVNPEHSEAGRALAAAELERRGVKFSLEELAEPTWLTTRVLDQAERHFFGPLARFERLIGQTIAWLGIPAYLAWFIGLWLPKTPALSPFLDALSVIVALLLVLGIVLVALATLRRKRARILLLRRFNKAEIERRLSRLVRRQIAPFGPTLTLSDRFFKYKTRGSFVADLLALTVFVAAGFLLFLVLAWSVAVMALAQDFLVLLIVVAGVGGAVVASFVRTRLDTGDVSVRSTVEFRNLARRIRRRLSLVVSATVGTRASRVINTSDDWWKQGILLLMHSCDVIVVDVSEVSEGTKWELETSALEGVRSRLVFVAFDETLELARTKLEEAGLGHAVIHGFNKKGELADVGRFRSAMIGAMRTRLGAPRSETLFPAQATGVSA